MANPKATKTEFHLSEMKFRQLNRSIPTNIVLVLVFFVVFNLMFQQNEGYQEFIRYLLIVIFLVVGILIIFSDLLAIRRAQTVHYLIKDDGLYYFDGKKEHFYPWTSFKRVSWNKNKVHMQYPVWFETTEGNFFLNKNIEDEEWMLPQICDHVKDIAEMDPELPVYVLKGPHHTGSAFPKGIR